MAVRCEFRALPVRAAHSIKMGNSNQRHAAVSTTVVGANSFALPTAPASANEFAPTGSYKHLLEQALFEGFGVLNLLGDGFDFLVDGGVGVNLGLCPFARPMAPKCAIQTTGAQRFRRPL